MTSEDRQHKLTRKQQAFITVYLSNGFNATKAAIAAGYSRNSAYSIGWENLKKPEIAEAIEQALNERGITPATCQVLLGEMAFGADIVDFEPWLHGEKTLEQLRSEGIDTSLVRAARISNRGVYGRLGYMTVWGHCGSSPEYWGWSEKGAK